MEIPSPCRNPVAKLPKAGRIHKKRDLAWFAKSPKQVDNLWCRGPESNWGHEDFQSTALPTELPRHDDIQP
jgi:hypothetical protein